MSAPQVVMYSTLFCPYCTRARQLLHRKGVEPEEIRIDLDHDQMTVMMERSRRHTVPQIFIGEIHVGGFDDLARLEARGELDPLLGRAPRGRRAAGTPSEVLSDEDADR